MTAEEIRDVVRSLKDHAAHPVAMPCELPHRTMKEFFGRSRELAELTDRLRAGRNTAVVGPAGYGKTALAAEAVRAVVGENGESLANSPFPDGVVFLDLYQAHGEAGAMWHELANRLRGPKFMETAQPANRARAACRDRRVLIIIEGDEETQGVSGWTKLTDLLSVLAIENRRLLLTRNINHALPAETISLNDELEPAAAAKLFDDLCDGQVTGETRKRILQQINGHPLALTWTGNLVGMPGESANSLADELEADPKFKLRDPILAQYALEWLFNRSVGGLDATSLQALAAFGLLARAPVPLAAIESVIDQSVIKRMSVERSATVGRCDIKLLIQRGLLRRSSGKRDHYEFAHVLGHQFARIRAASNVGLRTFLANWLNQQLSASLKDVPESTNEIAELLQHVAALLRTDHDRHLWRQLTKFLLYDVHDRLVSLGRMDEVSAALGAVNDWLDGLPAERTGETFWQRERASLLQKLGDLAWRVGNHSAAQKFFRDFLSITQSLAESDPAHAEWQRYQSVSFNRLGELAMAQGNLSEAQRRFDEAHRIVQRLAESGPTNAVWQQDLSVSFEKLGELAVEQGDLPEGQLFFREALRISEQLAAFDPANAMWQRDQVTLHQRLATLARHQGDNAAHTEELWKCYLVLQRMKEQDHHFDPPLVELSRRLHFIFGDLD